MCDSSFGQKMFSFYTLLFFPFSKYWGQRNKICTKQQPPQRGGAVTNPVRDGSKWLLAFPKVPVTPGSPYITYLFAVLPFKQPQKGSTQSLKNRSPVSSFFLNLFARIHIFLLFPVSGKVHAYPGSVFPSSMCVLEMGLAMLKWVHVLATFLIQI